MRHSYEATGKGNNPQWNANALDRQAAAGKIRKIDLARVTFIVRTIPTRVAAAPARRGHGEPRGDLGQI